MRRISEEFSQELAEFIDESEVELTPLDIETVLLVMMPRVNLNDPISAIADATAKNLKSSGLYRFVHRLVTVNEEGQLEDMDVDRFRTWIDRFQTGFYKWGDSPNSKITLPIHATMRKDQATVLLKSDEFLEQVPRLDAIFPIRMPVLAEEGIGVRLLPYGYDSTLRILTVDTGIGIAVDWDVERGAEYLNSILEEFPFGEGRGRSLAVQVAAMLTPFCHLMLPKRSPLPLIYYNANTPGCGKTRLAEFCVYPMYGMADILTYGDGKSEEFKKELDSWSLRQLAFCFIDDVSGSIKSNLLNRWLTSPTWSGRVMHSQRQFSVLNRAITLLTGNQASLSSDLARRALIVDLWSPELPADRARRLSRVIDQTWLSAPENRGKILSALWALVRHWGETGAKRYNKCLPSFEGWSRIIPAIARGGGFECPLQSAKLPDAGDKREVEFQRMLVAAVNEYELCPEGINLPIREWCALCREHELFHAEVGDVETCRAFLDANPKHYERLNDAGSLKSEEKNYQALRYMNHSHLTKFGGMLHTHFRGAERQLEGGLRVKFADRKARRSSFTLRLCLES